jgi:hypothetical protein
VDICLRREGRCKKGVAVAGRMGLDGRLFRINGLYEKVRGAAANGITHYIVPAGNVQRSHGEVLVEWVKKDKPPVAQGNRWEKGCGYVAEMVKVDRSSSSRVQVLAAERMEDLLTLCLVGDGAWPDRNAVVCCGSVSDTLKNESVRCRRRCVQGLERVLGCGPWEERCGK